MKLTIFGATGGIGRQALEQAIAAGHDLTAVVRDPHKLAGTQARVATADLSDTDPVRLTDKPLTGTYRTAYGQNVRHGLFISRADVAHCMLRVLREPETYGQTVGIAN